MTTVDKNLKEISCNDGKDEGEACFTFETGPFYVSDGIPNYSVSETDSENNDGVEDVRKGRKRVRNGSKQEKHKLLKDCGKKYKSYRGTGREVEERKPGDPCNCKLKCFERLSEKERFDIFQDFWGLGNHNLQNAYLQDCIRKKEIKRKTKKEDTRRTCTMEYCLTVDSKEFIVCKQAFIAIHGIGRGRLEIIVSKIRNGEDLEAAIDKRGQHHHHKKKYSEEDLQNVKSFILTLPNYESRHKMSHKNSELTIRLMYDKYKKSTLEMGRNPVSEDKFRRVFSEELNSFKSSECDASTSNKFWTSVSHFAVCSYVKK